MLCVIAKQLLFNMMCCTTWWFGSPALKVRVITKKFVKERVYIECWSGYEMVQSQFSLLFCGALETHVAPQMADTCSTSCVCVGSKNNDYELAITDTVLIKQWTEAK